MLNNVMNNALSGINAAQGGLSVISVSYTHLRAHETGRNLVCRLLLEKKKKSSNKNIPVSYTHPRAYHEHMTLRPRTRALTYTNENVVHP